MQKLRSLASRIARFTRLGSAVLGIGILAACAYGGVRSVQSIDRYRDTYDLFRSATTDGSIRTTVVGRMPAHDTEAVVEAIDLALATRQASYGPAVKFASDAKASFRDIRFVVAIGAAPGLTIGNICRDDAPLDKVTGKVDADEIRGAAAFCVGQSTRQWVKVHAPANVMSSNGSLKAFAQSVARGVLPLPVRQQFHDCTTAACN